MAIAEVTDSYAACLDRIEAGPARVGDLLRALTTADEVEEAALFAAADRVRHDHVGDGVHLRALIEFSSYCSRTCRYCGLRAERRDAGRYRLAPDEIVAAAAEAAGLGYRTVVLQSGEDAWYTAEVIADVVRRIKATADVAVTLCVGERPDADYALWRHAGAERYLLRIETSYPRLYAALHPGMSFDSRLRCLDALRRLGYEVGSGVLVGLPGQTPEMLARDLLFLRDLPADMVGLGPLLPHPGTPLAACEAGGVDATLRMIALTRLLLPDAHIVATTALGTLDPMGREKGLRAGGNVAMPNVTPQRCRPLYEIYPGKICINESATKCRGCIELRIRGIGRYLARDKGSAARPVSAAGRGRAEA